MDLLVPILYFTLLTILAGVSWYHIKLYLSDAKLYRMLIAMLIFISYPYIIVRVVKLCGMSVTSFVWNLLSIAISFAMGVLIFSEEINYKNLFGIYFAVVFVVIIIALISKFVL